MTAQFNRNLNRATRLQSSLGRQYAVGATPADVLVLAQVLQVNYVYNTVDVVTVNRGELLTKNGESQGRFSAKLPVDFGGKMSSGHIYGSRTPINIGDLVLIGFLNKDKNAPIVINRYFGESESSILNTVRNPAANPEDPTVWDDSLANLTVYPNQTYEFRDGKGNVESTFVGNSFIKVAAGLVGSGRLNDTTYDASRLQKHNLGDYELTPANQSKPQFLIQNQGANSDNINSLLIDDNGDTRLSSRNKGSRSEIGTKSSDGAYMRSQGNSTVRSDDDSSFSEIGVANAVAYLRNKDHKLELTAEGVLVDGKQLGDFGGGGDFSEQVEKLQTELNELRKSIGDHASKDIEDLKEQIQAVQSNLDNLFVDGKLNSDFIKRVSDAEKQAGTAVNIATSTAKMVSDAAGSYPNIIDRLTDMEASANSLRAITKEVIDARKYKDITYQSLSEHITTIHTVVDSLVTKVADYDTLKANVTALQKSYETINKDFYTLRNKMSSFFQSIPDNHENDYMVAVTSDVPTTLRNGKGTIVLTARVYRIGFDVTDMFEDYCFKWVRQSGRERDDQLWAQDHQEGSKTLTVTGKDFGFSADFVCNFNPVAKGD